MIIDRLAKQIHRRGFLAALAALAVPTAARAQVWQCSPPGGGCTLLIPCCGGEACFQQSLLNPNSGVCGGVRDDDDGPFFISPTTGGGSDDGYLTRAELLAKYDRNGDGDLNCLEDFNDDHALAQAAFDDNPTDPFRLDQGGTPGVPCEMLL